METSPPEGSPWDYLSFLLSAYTEGLLCPRNGVRTHTVYQGDIAKDASIQECRIKWRGPLGLDGVILRQTLSRV